MTGIWDSAGQRGRSTAPSAGGIPLQSIRPESRLCSSQNSSVPQRPEIKLVPQVTRGNHMEGSGIHAGGTTTVPNGLTPEKGRASCLVAGLLPPNPLQGSLPWDCTAGGLIPRRCRGGGEGTLLREYRPLCVSPIARLTSPPVPGQSTPTPSGTASPCYWAQPPAHAGFPLPL